MEPKWKWSLLLLVGVLLTAVAGDGTEEDAQKYLDELEVKFNQLCVKSVASSWVSNVNITDETRKAASDDGDEFSQFNLDVQKEVNTRFPNRKSFKDKRLRRAFKFLASVGPAGMDPAKLKRMDDIGDQMQTAYSTATICKYGDPNDCKYRLQDAERFLRAATDVKEMEHYWTQWHDAMSSRVSVDLYGEFVDLLNEYAKANGYKSEADLWMEPYDDNSDDWAYENFEKMVIQLEREVNPMYDILHAWVRWKLRQLPEYKDIIKPCGYLPAHILGNMWSQEWSNLDSMTNPFPKAPKLDCTDAMQKSGYTPLRMFQESDKFYEGLGLMPVFPEFYEKSVLERPKVGEINCHASAWDMCNGKGGTDFRIKQCTVVNQKDFITVHHEMGHTQYQMQYRDLPFVFRTSANPGFHEAIGDSLALAVVTPGHLQCILKLDLGLPADFCDKIKTGPFDVTETDLNYLYFTALQKIAFLPFAASMDIWRWDIFEGRSKPSQYQYKWWESRRRNQGIVPPGDRKNKTGLFDAMAKFHIPANIDYVRYYIAGILAFDFYEQMCIAAGEYKPDDPKTKPLYMCDFTGSKEAGALMTKMLKMGFEKGWPDAMEAMTGRRTMTTEPMRHYLQPVLDYMEKELKAAGEVIGFGFKGTETEDCDEVKELKAKPRIGVDEYWKKFKEGTLY